MGITGEEHESIVRWFARQGYRVRQKIVTQFSQSLIETGPDRLSREDIYKNFLKVIIENGWRISEKISSKYHLCKYDLQQADQSEIEKALKFTNQYRRRSRFDKLKSNMGLILRLREEGMTYKDIAMYFTKVKKIKVSKTLIYNLITEYKEQNKNKV
jgi:hypothetical protein